MIDCDNEYLLIDEDGKTTFTNKMPDLDSSCWPLKFRVSSIPESCGYVLEKLDDNEWKSMGVNNDK